MTGLLWVGARKKKKTKKKTKQNKTNKQTIVLCSYS